MDGGTRTEETELIAMLSISRRNLITLGASFFAAGALAGCGDGDVQEVRDWMKKVQPTPPF